PLRRDVRGHLAEEIHDGALSERLNLRGQARRQVQPGQLGADPARAGPALRLCADVLGHRPVGLVPEDEVGFRLERRLGPLLAERAVYGVVEATGRDAAAVVQHLAGLGMERDPTALRLAAERAPNAPGTHLHLEAE